jgi:GMP synthase-like glutamine amidotransferase
MIGEALGGRVTKAASGWLVGAHSFEVTGEEPWMEPPLRQLTLLMMCQDQVVEVPEGTTVLARSASCPNGIIRVGPNMLGIQGHPEFSVGFERALIAVNSRYLAPGQAVVGEESLSQPVHSAEVGQWMARFFNEFRPV